MKLVVLSLVAATAAAFTSQSAAPRPATSLRDGMADLEAIAEKSNPVLKVRFFLYGCCCCSEWQPPHTYLVLRPLATVDYYHLWQYARSIHCMVASVWNQAWKNCHGCLCGIHSSVEWNSLSMGHDYWRNSLSFFRTFSSRTVGCSSHVGKGMFAKCVLLLYEYCTQHEPLTHFHSFKLFSLLDSWNGGRKQLELTICVEELLASFLISQIIPNLFLISSHWICLIPLDFRPTNRKLPRRMD